MWRRSSPRPERKSETNSLRHRAMRLIDSVRSRLAAVMILVALPATMAFGQGTADNEYQTGAVLWMQSSGERAALSYQAFSLARMVLDRDLRTNRSRMRRAIIVDIDETIMDNSPYQASLIKNHQSFSDPTWQAWVNRTDAKSSSKEPRRLSVSAKYRVVLLMGDNLNDFSDVFENAKTVSARMSVTDQNQAKFGARFIVLPNPMYGDWESAIYEYQTLSDAEKDAKRKATLKD